MKASPPVVRAFEIISLSKHHNSASMIAIVNMHSTRSSNLSQLYADRPSSKTKTFLMRDQTMRLSAKDEK